MISKDQLKRWLAQPKPTEDIVASIRKSTSTPMLLDAVRKAIPDVTTIPQTTYTLYRQFEHTGVRDHYQAVYFAKRSKLTRAVLEMIMGDDSYRDAIQDLLWSICEETSWVLPAHEEQGPLYWDIDPPIVRTRPLGAHTVLTREPDAIDLFAAETGAQLAEAIYFLGERLAPEVRQRVRQEVQRHIFEPYLSHGRRHWWHKGPLNWNGVCNGSIGLAFLRMEHDLETLADALSMVLEGFEAYIATGFEADGGSIEGVGYWNYGLMYYVTVAELLREITGGELDLLTTPRLRDIVVYPVGLAFTPNTFVNFGDATESVSIASGIAERLAERTGVSDLRALLDPAGQLDFHSAPVAKLPIIFRQAAWWPASPPPPLPHRDYYLPDCGVVKYTGRTPTDQLVIFAVKAGFTDGHHVHCDIGQFVLHIDGESLIPDAGRGHYSKDYFRRKRYENIFNNSFSHNVPRIGGKLQAHGPEFGGHKQYYGKITSQGQKRDGTKFVEMEIAHAYDLPTLKGFARSLTLNSETGVLTLTDDFQFDGAPLEIEEAFVTWFPVKVDGAKAWILGQRTTLELKIETPAENVVFTATSLEEQCRANQRDGVLTRLAVSPGKSQTRFVLHITPHAAGEMA
jgi:hypothetical protein